jgi:hypothetical protein
MDRRELLKVGIPILTMLIPGCMGDDSSDPNPETPIEVINKSGKRHLVSVSITTVPEEHGGFTKYFSDVHLVEGGSRHTFDEGMGGTDHTPEIFVLVALDNETVGQSSFEYSSTMSRIKIRVTEEGDVEIQP